MWCFHLYNKHFLFCILQFFQGISSTISLCMSSYGLAYSIGKEWEWENIIIVSCIMTTIICNSIKDALIANPKLLIKDDEKKEENPNYIDI